MIVKYGFFDFYSDQTQITVWGGWFL